MLVINDDSDSPVEDHDTVKDLLTLMRKNGNEVLVIHGRSGSARHQKSMEALPDSIEFIVRIDDDLLATPAFLEDILQPFRYFPNEPLGAVGGLYPEPYMRPIDLNVAVTTPSFVPTFEEPVWSLQGHYYTDEPQVLEVESLIGHSICYRRSAVQQVGGWAVNGYSNHANREESDLCARLIASGFKLMVTTQALAWHLYSPSGGSRQINKTSAGNVLVSNPGPIDEDDRLFRARLSELKAGMTSPRPTPGRFRIAELEKNQPRWRPLVTRRHRALRAVERNLLRPARRLAWYFSGRAVR